MALFESSLLALYQCKITPHQGATLYFIHHLNPHLLLKNHPKMLKKQSQEKSILEVVFSGGVHNPCNMTDHNCRKVDLLPPVQQVNEALMHGIRKVAALTPWDDIIYNKLEEQLVYRCHVTFLDGLGCFQPCLLTQFLGEF